MGLKRLYIDVPALVRSGADVSGIACGYPYHRSNDGVAALLEIAQLAVYCRHCPDPFCMAACPKDALERREDGMIHRSNLRCVGCRSCVLACPFGTLLPEAVRYVTARCDYCLSRLERDATYVPLCVQTAPHGVLQMRELDVEDESDHLFLIGDHLAVQTPSWRQKEALS